MAWDETNWNSAQQILERLRELAADPRYSAVCTVADFAPVAGRGGNTAEGRTTNFVRIGRQGAGSVTPVKIVVVGGIHAREWAPPHVLTVLIKNLLEAWASSSDLPIGGAPCPVQDVQRIIDTVDLYIAPMINPDGYERSRTAGERDWRKNNRAAPAPLPAGNTCALNSRFIQGVDINRNFDVLWDPDLHYAPGAVTGDMSKDPCEPQQTYGGTGPFSEPETNNVKFLQDKNPHYYVDVHMWGRKIYHAWGTEDNQRIAALTPQLDPTVLRDGHNVGGVTEPINGDFLDEITTITDMMCSGTSLATGNQYGSIAGADEGAFGGASDDYATSRNLPSTAGGLQPIRAFTIECGLTFTDPFAIMVTTTLKEVQAALLGLLRYAITPRGRAALDPQAAPGSPGSTGGGPHGCNSCGGCSFGIAGSDPGGEHP